MASSCSDIFQRVLSTLSSTTHFFFSIFNIDNLQPHESFIIDLREHTFSSAGQEIYEFQFKRFIFNFSIFSLFGI